MRRLMAIAWECSPEIGSDTLGRWFREPLTPEQPKNQVAQITRSRVITHTSGNRAERHVGVRGRPSDRVTPGCRSCGSLCWGNELCVSLLDEPGRIRGQSTPFG